MLFCLIHFTFPGTTRVAEKNLEWNYFLCMFNFFYLLFLVIHNLLLSVFHFRVRGARSVTRHT